MAHYLIEEAKAGGFQGESWKWMKGDSLLAIVAGRYVDCLQVDKKCRVKERSEPTAVVLMGLCAHLAKHPKHADKIYEEVNAVDVQM